MVRNQDIFTNVILYTYYNWCVKMLEPPLLTNTDLIVTRYFSELYSIILSIRKEVL